MEMHFYNLIGAASDLENALEASINKAAALDLNSVSTFWLMIMKYNGLNVNYELSKNIVVMR